MSLSDRQRRGAFKVCWSDTESVVAMSLGVVLQTVPAVPSQSVVPPTSAYRVPPPAVPQVPPSEVLPPPTPSRVPHDSPPGQAVPEPPARYTRDTRHSYPLRRPTAHVPAPARARVPPSGGCPAVRRHTSQPPVSPGRQSHADTRSSLALSARLPAPRCYPSGIPLFRPAVCPTLRGTDCQRECSRVPLVSNRARPRRARRHSPETQTSDSTSPAGGLPRR